MTDYGSNPEAWGGCLNQPSNLNPQWGLQADGSIHCQTHSKYVKPAPEPKTRLEDALRLISQLPDSHLEAIRALDDARKVLDFLKNDARKFFQEVKNG